MLKKTRLASVAALAVAGVAMSGSPAAASDGDTVGIGNGSQVSVLDWQICHSNVPIGVITAAVPIGSPNVGEDCVNATQVDTDMQYPHGDGDTVGILNDAQVSVLDWQICGSNVPIGLVSLAVPVLSPNVTDDCVNAPQVD